MLEKQHNRGQDGAGVATIKLNMNPGERYISRVRSNAQQPIKEVFARIQANFAEHPTLLTQPEKLKQLLPYTGELLLGHLRYGTHGGNSIEQCHPFLRQSNWKSRNLVLAGNFNLTNVEELFQQLVALGQHPKEMADTVTVMEKIGHFLDEENTTLHANAKAMGLSGTALASWVEQHLNLAQVLNKASKHWDGGYAMCGLLGHGEAFVLRDPNGIRPVFYYENEDIIAVASERPVLQTAFNISMNDVKELGAGNALILPLNGTLNEVNINPAGQVARCSFERIYFSRGNDAAIYQERQQLGYNLAPIVLQHLNVALQQAVFTYIPNTAEVAFYGLIKSLEQQLNERKAQQIAALKVPSTAALAAILQQNVRIEKIAIKDAKLRTFITQDKSRNDLVSHVYDITYGSITPFKDALVALDDSIVRGTTLKNSILKMLGRLNPSQIIIVSSAPQIRYPDCYGIDMSNLGDLVAFKAAVQLLHKTNNSQVLQEVYARCLGDQHLPKEQVQNHVCAIYAPFTANEIADEIALIVTPEAFEIPVKVIFQTIEGLHAACPNHKGDWYFTGNYPTPGGNKVANQAFINYMEGRVGRSY